MKIYFGGTVSLFFVALILSLGAYAKAGRETVPESSYIPLRNGIIRINNPVMIPANTSSVIYQGGQQISEDQMDWSQPYCMIVPKHQRAFTLMPRKLKITKVAQLKNLEQQNHYFVALITAEDPDINSFQCGEKEILSPSGNEPNDQEVGLGLNPAYIKKVMRTSGHFLLEIPLIVEQVPSVPPAPACTNSTYTQTFTNECHGLCDPTIKQEQTQSQLWQYRNLVEAQYGKENVLSVTVGQCDYIKGTNVWKHYCDLNAIVKICN